MYNVLLLYGLCLIANKPFLFLLIKYNHIDTSDSKQSVAQKERRHERDKQAMERESSSIMSMSAFPLT